MSATSGIHPSQDLTLTFAQAVESKSVRFLKVSIQNESLVHDLSLPVAGSLDEDLSLLQDYQILHPSSPAYILAKLDPPSADWLAIFYVPEDAKVRDKMLYASTRANLLKGLGSSLFPDSIFATTKHDLTPGAYVAHQRHQAAPKPLSSREQEAADLRVAENAAASYAGSRSRTNHVGTGVGLNWSPEAEEAVAQFAQGDQCTVVILTIDTTTETIVLQSSSNILIDNLASALPASEPCYALLLWTYAKDSDVNREIVFIYSCPSSSPIKNRMIYSSASSTAYMSAKAILSSSSTYMSMSSRKIEMSDPKELDESFLKTELCRSDDPDPLSSPAVAKPFAKPRGPGRRK